MAGKLVRALITAWNRVKEGSLTAELEQAQKILEVKLTPTNLELDLLEPKNSLVQSFKNIIVLTALLPAVPKLEKLRVKEKLAQLKEILSALEPLAAELASENKIFILKSKKKELLKLGSGASSPALRMLGINNLAVPHKFALLKFIKELG